MTVPSKRYFSARRCWWSTGIRTGWRDEGALARRATQPQTGKGRSHFSTRSRVLQSDTPTSHQDRDDSAERAAMLSGIDKRAGLRWQVRSPFTLVVLMFGRL